MSLILQAPLPGLVTTTILPNPNMNDSEGLRLKPPQVRFSMAGTFRTYVKSNARSKLLYSFTLSRMKALELKAFVQAYYRAKIQLVNHKNETWHVYFTVNPFEFNGAGRADGWPGGEVMDIVLELEGIQVS